MTLRERPTVSIPCLGNKIGLVHVCDAKFDDQGVLIEYKPPGEGDVEIARQIELLRGVGYDGYLVFEWPKASTDALSTADVVLPQVAKFLTERLNEEQSVLSAYKGDKYAPKMASRAVV
jgi:sugar phosphate isomerase/epimerase